MNPIKDIEVLTTAVELAGFRVIHTEAGNMDSGICQFYNGIRTDGIVKDKGQWMLKESRQKLEPLGLFRAFNDTLEFRDALLNYVKRHV